MNQNNGKNENIYCNNGINNDVYLEQLNKNRTLIIRFNSWDSVNTLSELGNEITRNGRDIGEVEEFFKIYYSDEKNVKYLLWHNLRVLMQNDRIYNIQKRNTLYKKLYTICQLTNNNYGCSNAVEYVLKYIEKSQDFKDNKELVLLVMQDFLTVLKSNKIAHYRAAINTQKRLKLRQRHNEHYKSLIQKENRMIEIAGQLAEKRHELMEEKILDINGDCYCCDKKRRIKMLKERNAIYIRAIKESRKFGIGQQYLECDSDSERPYKNYFEVDL